MMRFKHRTWGWYLVLLDRKHFKVKLLRFKKNGELSLQWHEHRSELWLFLSGRGYISDNKQCWYESLTWTFGNPGYARNIFPMEKHTFIAEKVTWVIEIQYGEKCEESDIVRI